MVNAGGDMNAYSLRNTEFTLIFVAFFHYSLHTSAGGKSFNDLDAADLLKDLYNL